VILKPNELFYLQKPFTVFRKILSRLILNQRNIEAIDEYPAFKKSLDEWIWAATGEL